MVRTSVRQQARAIARIKAAAEATAAEEAEEAAIVIAAKKAAAAKAAKKARASKTTAGSRRQTSSKKKIIPNKKKITPMKPSSSSRRSGGGRNVENGPSIVDWVECETSGVKFTIHRATVKDLKEQQKKKNNKKRDSSVGSTTKRSQSQLWIVTSSNQRQVHYQEAAICICEKEQSLLPAYGGRSWEVTCTVTEDDSKVNSSKVLFRWYRGRMELACLPHLIERIPSPPTWPGRAKVEDEEWDMHQEQDDRQDDDEEKENLSYIRQLQHRQISNLSTVAWDLRNDGNYPIPLVSVRWKSPDQVNFTSRKAAWEYATKLSKQQVYIQKHVQGIGTTGKLLQPFLPSGPEALKVGLLRFQRDGLWVCGQELSWQESRPKELHQLEMQKQEELEKQRQEELEKQQQELRQELLEKEEVKTTGTNSYKGKKESLTTSIGSFQKTYIRKPTGLSVYVECNRRSFQKEQTKFITLREADIELRKNWKTLSSDEQSKYIELAKEQRHKFYGEGDGNEAEQEVANQCVEKNDSEDTVSEDFSTSSPQQQQQQHITDLTAPSSATSKVQEMEERSIASPYLVVSTASNAVRNDGDNHLNTITTEKKQIPISSTLNDIDGNIIVEEEKKEEDERMTYSRQQVLSSSLIANQVNTLTTTSTTLTTTTTTGTSSRFDTKGGCKQERTTDNAMSSNESLGPKTMPAAVDLGIISVKKKKTKAKKKSMGTTPVVADTIVADTVVSYYVDKKKILKANQRRNKYCLTSSQIALLNEACVDHFDRVMRTVKARDLLRELQDGFDLLRERGRGRYDMELPAFDEPSPSRFDFLTDLTKAPWMPIVRKILGEHVTLIHKGFFLSLPGAETQVYHQDGLHLTKHCQRPCHAINVFVPLVDLTNRNGPTEFCLGSHILGHEDYDRDFLETPKVTAGTPIIFDYRLGHRGLGNSSMASRPVVYCTYARAAIPTTATTQTGKDSTGTTTTDGNNNNETVVNNSRAMKEFRDSINFSRRRYHKIGNLIEKPLSREERSKKRKRSMEKREEDEVKKAIALSIKEEEDTTTTTTETERTTTKHE